MKLSSTILKGTASLLVLGALGATAQAQEASSELQEIVVTGYRASLAKAIDIKKEATSLVDAISSEDIGKFPDKNVAESLSHIPGITLDRDFGEGERVSIRGTDPALNRTLLNGQTIASTDWFILDAPGRTFNYTMLAPEIVGQAEVYKSPEARIDEGSIGGTVILNTRKPLDMKSLTLSGSIEYGYNDRAKKGDVNASGMLSWKNEDSTFGAIVSLMHQKQNVRRDGFETLGYPTVGGSVLQTLVDDDTLPAADVRFPNVINAALFQQTRKRDGATLGLQFRPNDKLEIEANGIYVKGRFDNTNQSRYYFNGWGGDSISNVQVSDGYVNGMDVENGLVLIDAIHRESQVKTWAADLKATWSDDSWRASVQGGRTHSSGGTQRELLGEFELRTDYSFDTSGAPGDLATVTASHDASDPSGVNLGWQRDMKEPTTDAETYIQADYAHDLDLGVVKEALFGVKYRDHDTSRVQIRKAINGFALPLSDLTIPAPGNFMKGLGVSGDLANGAYVDMDALADVLRDPPNGYAFDNAEYRYLPEGFSVNEKIAAAYGQVNLKGEGFRGNIGVRLVHTKQTSTSDRDITGGIWSAPIADPANIVTDVLKKSYTDILPSANLVFDLTPTVLGRFSASKTIARANYSDLSAYLTLDNSIHSGAGGNPDLNPYKANSFDAALEWYPNKNTLLSAGVFYKDIGSYIFSSTAEETHYNTETDANEIYTISRPHNGGNAELKGVELTYQGDIAMGFGLQVNYTYTDSKVPAGQPPLPFASKHSFNVTPYFEKGGFSARLTYAYRSKYFRGFDRSTQVFNDSFNELDASISYAINDNIELTAQAQNLLDETQYQYVELPTVPYNAYKNGRRFFAGVRFKY